MRSHARRAGSSAACARSVTVACFAGYGSLDLCNVTHFGCWSASTCRCDTLQASDTFSFQMQTVELLTARPLLAVCLQPPSAGRPYTTNTLAYLCACSDCCGIWCPVYPPHKCTGVPGSPVWRVKHNKRAVLNSRCDQQAVHLVLIRSVQQL